MKTAMAARKTLRDVTSWWCGTVVVQLIVKPVLCLLLVIHERLVASVNLYVIGCLMASVNLYVTKWLQLHALVGSTCCG